MPAVKKVTSTATPATMAIVLYLLCSLLLIAIEAVVGLALRTETTR